MKYTGLEDTVYFRFTTRDFDTGAPQTLGGTPAISVYEDNNLTEITAGVTLTANYDSRTGLNNVAVVASTANGYEAGKTYSLVITTGTVDTVSVVGEVVGEFHVMAANVYDALLGSGAAAFDANSRVDVGSWLGTAAATPSVAGVPEVDLTHVAGATTNVSTLATDVNAIITDTADMQPKLGTPAGASISADIAVIDGVVDQILTDSYDGPRGAGVYFDDASGATGTTLGTHGTFGNAVNSIGDAKTIADSLGTRRIYIVNDSTATLTAVSWADYEFVGIGHCGPAVNEVQLASRTLDNASFFNVHVTGVQGGTNRARYEDCSFGQATLHCLAIGCLLTDDVGTGITFSNNDDNILDRCASAVPGNSAPYLDGSAASLALSIRHYSGGIEFTGLSSGAAASVETDGQVIFGAACNVNATVTVRGWLSITDNTAGMSALTFEATPEYLTNSTGATGYDPSTDSLQAIRAQGDAAWITGGGGSITDILNVQPVVPTSIDLANTATVRVGLMLTNALDDLPSTAEITPGTVDIHRKAIGGTSWSAIVTAGACSEQAGMVYYDEVFDTGAGYAEGDSIRVTFKSQKITVSANDYEVTDANGVMFQTEIRQTMRGTDSALLASSNGSGLTEAGGTGDHLTAIPTDASLATAANLATAQLDLDTLTGTDGATLATSQPNYAPAKAGDSMALTAAAVDAVWDETMTAHATADSAAVHLKDTLADTNELQSDDVPTLIAALQTDLDTLTDAYSEPTGAPGVSETLVDKVGYLYMALRNKVDVTASAKTYYDNGGTSEWKKTLSDDGTTYSEAEGTVP